MLQDTKEIYRRFFEENCHTQGEGIVEGIKQILEEFDANWVEYEKLYVVELMLIEQDARRFIQEAIDIERDI